MECTCKPTPSGVSVKNQWLYASAFVGAWGPLSVFVLYRTTLFLVWYQGDAVAIGVTQLICGLIDVFNGPLLASLADSATLNRLRCFPLLRWGRRAPFIMLGAPLMMAGPVLMWLIPSRDKTTVSIWHALCYVCFVNGNTMTLNAYLSTRQELYPTGEERALSVFRHTPFMLLTYALSAAPIVLAFTSNPEIEGRCCANARTDCSAPPSCYCYANASAWSALDESTPPTAVLGETGLSHVTLFQPAYVAACVTGLGGGGGQIDGGVGGDNVGGGGGGAGAISVTFSDISAAREAACAIPLIPRGRFAACALLTLLMGMCVYLAIAPARTTGPRSHARGGSTQPALVRSVLRTFRSVPFLVYALQALLATTWSSFVLANFGIYLIYIAGIEPVTAVGSSAIIGIVMVVSRVTMLPVFTRLLLRFPRHAHPARTLGYMRLVEACLTPVLFYSLTLPGINLTALLVMSGLLIGFVSSPYDMCNHMLVGWAIDEDAARRPGEPRREGMFYACNAMMQHCSQLIIGAATIGWGVAGYDASLCTHEQPASAMIAIEYSFLVALPILSVLAAAVSFAYPLQGERLRKLKALAEKQTPEVTAAKGHQATVTVHQQGTEVNGKEVETSTKT